MRYREWEGSGGGAGAEWLQAPASPGHPAGVCYEQSLFSLPWASGFWNLRWEAAVREARRLDDELAFHAWELCVAPGTPAVGNLRPGAVVQREGVGTTPPYGPNGCCWAPGHRLLPYMVV